MAIMKAFGAICVLLILFSCTNDPLDIDSSKIKVSIPYYNMDSVFVFAKGDELIKWNQKFKAEINEAYMYELGVGLRLQSDEDSTILANIALFSTDSFMMKFEKRIREKFPNLISNHGKIEAGFRNLKYHFPDMEMPSAIVFANTVFQSSAFSTQKELVIGIERYLGKEDDLIQQLPPQVFYEWIKEGMEPIFLERDALNSWILTHIVVMNEGNLAENMINWGKALYFTQASYPDLPLDVIIRYTPEDLKWAEDNEASFWKYLVKEKMLFRIDQDESINMLAPGPFTPGLPEKGPDRLGQFLGWKIVRKYMEENDELTLKQLLNTPYNKILQAYEID
jgi:hypothetical protein